MAYSAAQLLVDTVDALSRRAPAIVAAAAHQLGEIVLALHFGDDSHAELTAEHSRLLARVHRSEQPDVEAYFDNRAMNLLFDLQRRPVDQTLPASLDVRGPRAQTLAVWRTFQLLSQRASGLRAIQAMWKAYRDQYPERWGSPATDGAVNEGDPAFPPPRGVRWRALDFLDQRHPEDQDLAPETVGGTINQDERTLWDNRVSTSWWQFSGATDADLLETMERCKERVQEEIRRIIPARDPGPHLYELMHTYPARRGKGLRPTLTLASCVAAGGRSEDAMRAAAAIELFHNGFLIHDDVADESTHRRGEETLHGTHGAGLAVNTGDGMNLLAVDTVLSNLDTLGLARTLGLIHEVMHMCRETIEGQALELGWIREGVVPPGDEDYFYMSTKKTGWYTAISPCRMGAVSAGVTDPVLLNQFNDAFRLIGIAFQIQDDVLNLVGETTLYGKEPLGDLLEGKRTVMLIHLFREADEATRQRLYANIRRLRAEKTQDDAEMILREMERFGSLTYAIDLADRLAHEGVRRFEEDLTFLPENEAKGVLRQIANYVTTRPL
ncbi:MAG TPA: polyprenyl synthetase family protein [Candidatus Sulfomarinibacteraceae bacterium]|nr:polyprenyl synthetase family protein [Candidatus Sulfomarinibacteraceae bacterium]